MDRARSGRSSNSSTVTSTPPTSSTTLSQDTDEILSSWHRFLEGCHPAVQRRAKLGAERLGYGSALLPTSSRYAGLRCVPALSRQEKRPTQQWTAPSVSSSSDCEGKDESDVSLGWSVCYAVTVLLTALFALTATVVLVQLIPAASTPRRLTVAAAQTKGVLRTNPTPSMKAKTLPGSTSRTVRTGLLHAVSSAIRRTTASRNFTGVKTTLVDKTEATTGGDVEEWHSPTVLLRQPPSDEISEEEHHLCGTVFYTYCLRPLREFYFDRAANSCATAATSYGVEVCNRSPNRFASRTSCERSCVDARRPSGRCLDRPLFSLCGSEDLKTRLWFFEAGACRPWDFPSGKCPKENSGLFRSHEACARKCSANRKYVPLCGTPPSGVCSVKELKYPYFAVKLPGEEKMRCLKTTALSLQKHLCLTGTNRFPALASCKRACGRRMRARHRG